MNNVKGNAAGQYLGYALQPVRLFYHLLSCPADGDVGLEHADDVSVHMPDGSTVVEQCKSALTSNPVSDWAEDLWKTFHLWIDNANAGIYDAAKTQFQLYVTPIKTGKLVKQLSDLSSEEEIKALLGDIALHRKKLSSSTKTAEHLNAVFAADLQLVIQIVQNFKLVSEDLDPLAPIYAHLDPTVSKETMEKACRYGIGDAMNLIDKAVKSGSASVISAKEFRTTFRAFVNKYDATNVLHSLADQPDAAVVQDTLSSAPPFVQQLKFINADIETTTRAASDYLRASADRTGWAAAGEIFEDSVSEYNDTLTQRYGHVRSEMELTQSELDSANRGLLVYHRCCQIPPVPLQGRVVPGYFIVGTFNDLADRSVIGWHPDYLTLIESEAGG
ncbi:MAG: hypothetical protein P1U69_13885 [Parvibaculaceae bacterium]|nr:hypothetical protein [Parvibaculaceae bacterium]|tara:strand:- start:7962 stop:9125 length:1164 start_codon:yes stop_codon:yes gene_type:complete